MNEYKLYLQCETENLKNLYANKLLHSENFNSDSGFDLYCPDDDLIYVGTTKLINLKVKCKMVKIVDNLEIPCGFYLYPRSSMGTKTPLQMANSVGIIDMGYRGNLGGCVRYNYTSKDIASFIENPNRQIYFNVECGSRLFQICSPTLEPFKVELVDELDTTNRGEGGFGSTGN